MTSTADSQSGVANLESVFRDAFVSFAIEPTLAALAHAESRPNG
jgi:hypothetical protein